MTDFEVRTKSSTFKTIWRALTQEEFDVLRDDIRSEYDYYVEENNRCILKKAGIAAGIGLSIVSLITGLALDLKRTGKDIEGSAKTHKWSPVGPGSKVPEKWTPLTPAKEVAGGALV